VASPLTELAEPNGFRRLSRLVLVTMPALRTGWLSRSGRYYAWAIALFYAGLLAFTTVRGVSDTLVSIVTRAFWRQWR
jgi:hypothetical protein